MPAPRPAAPAPRRARPAYATVHLPAAHRGSLDELKASMERELGRSVSRGEAALYAIREALASRERSDHPTSTAIADATP